MAATQPIPAAPIDPGWDIRFTRLAQAWRTPIELCALDLARRFQAIGLGSELQVRLTPRGLSTFLALLGRRGLICIVDLTLVDGRALGQGPHAALDIRLIDACGEVVAQGLAGALPGQAELEDAADQALPAAQLGRLATVVYIATLAHFELLQPATRQA